MGWHPDRELNPQYAGIPDVERHGAIIDHPDKRDPSKWCGGFVTFDTPEARALEAFQRARGYGERPHWTVLLWEPLTLEPSILCLQCQDHGYVREGRWVE